MDALIVVDMQNGIRRDPEKLDLDGGVDRINRLAERVRCRGGHVFFVQHDGNGDDGFAPLSDGWQILESIQVVQQDKTVRKTLHDPFWKTDLRDDLERLQVTRVMVSGWATDFCVNATVRTASAYGYKVAVASDCHTVADRPALSAKQVIDYHHWMWANLISREKVDILPESKL